MARHIVILGAGIAGTSAAHYILKRLAEKLDLKVVLISASDEYFWSPAAPRVAVPDQMNDDKIFFSIPKLFEKYASSRFEFIHGKAEHWDPENNSVRLAMNDESTREVAYDTIIIATGSAARDQMPWKIVGDSKQTHTAFADLREKIAKAKSIVVGGGGPTGVEFAGELGSAYAKLGEKSVSIVTPDDMLLEKRIMPRVRSDARKSLEKYNVRVITRTRVTEVAKDDKGATILTLTHDSGKTEMLKTDLFVPTWGMQFNSDFAPAHLRQPNGRLKVTKTMQAPGYDNAFIVGDVADGEELQIMFAEHQVKHVVNSLEQYFASGEVPVYVQKSWSGHVVSFGRDYASGELAGYKPWTWVMWYLKSRHLGTEYVADVAGGKRFVTAGSI